MSMLNFANKYILKRNGKRSEQSFLESIIHMHMYSLIYKFKT